MFLCDEAIYCGDNGAVIRLVDCFVLVPRPRNDSTMGRLLRPRTSSSSIRTVIARNGIILNFCKDGYDLYVTKQATVGKMGQSFDG